MVSAILLAAGESQRMGRPKQLLPFGSSTILGKTIDNLLSSRADEVIVVLGTRAGAMKQVIAGRQVKVVVNPDYRKGMSASLIAGIERVDSKAQWVMVALADQPLIDKDTYNRLIEGALGCDMGIILPTYRSKRGKPVIFSIKYKDELLGLDGDVGGREILRKHPDDILEVAVGSEGVTIDINNLDDYYSCLKLSA